MKNNLLFILCAFAFSNGIVEQGTFYSISLDENRNYTIYLPEGYYQSNAEYPVVYFLHGFGGDNNSYNSFHHCIPFYFLNIKLLDTY